MNKPLEMVTLYSLELPLIMSKMQMSPARRWLSDANVFQPWVKRAFLLLVTLPETLHLTGQVLIPFDTWRVMVLSSSSMRYVLE